MTSNRVYIRSIGTGVAGRQYDRLNNPVAIAVDQQDRVYIADNWGNYIKVYDKDGKFLTILHNGSSSSFQGQFRQAAGLTVDAGGNMYLADGLSHLIKKYMPNPYPGWRQMNVPGFGDVNNWGVWGMTVFSNTLFAGTAASYGAGGKLYKFENNDWTQVTTGGFGDSSNVAIDAFEVFNNQLYAGTWNQPDSNHTNGGQIWRSPTAAPGSWERVANNGINDPVNGEVMSLRAFNGFLYAGTWSYNTASHGGEIFRSDTGNDGSWTEVFSDTLPSHHRQEAVMTMEVFSNTLYAGMTDFNLGAELWRTTNGTTWTQANQDGFGDALNTRIISLEVFNNQLYAGVQTYDSVLEVSHGGQIWRSPDGLNWDKVVDAGFGNLTNWGVGGLVVYQGRNLCHYKQQRDRSRGLAVGHRQPWQLGADCMAQFWRRSSFGCPYLG